MLKLYNTLGKKIEEFKPIQPHEVRMYACGPTVYDFGHIGNFRTFVVLDLLRRYLRYHKYAVTQVMNLTDVDDKTIRGAQREGIRLGNYTGRYIKAFFEDLETLNIEKVEHYPRATEHIEDMVRLVKNLIENGFAYRSGGSIYFDISKFVNYGLLSGIKISKTSTRTRIDEDDYKNEACDFVLWKAWDTDDGDVFWETELGKGRPGWHIECSAMSTRYLGETFDIHAGGVDLIFPHHENEIAQSEASSRSKFVNYWIHSEHLLVEGLKMSKSFGNILTVREILRKGYSGRTIRYLLLTTHYRAQLNFTELGLKQAEASLKRLDDFIQRLRSIRGGVHNSKIHQKCLELQRKFEEAMDNDLNLPEALAKIFAFIRDINGIIDQKCVSKDNLDEIYNVILMLDETLGILKHDIKESIPEDLMQLIKLREAARNKHNWSEADRIRLELFKKGVILEDTPEGVKWKLKQ